MDRPVGATLTGFQPPVPPGPPLISGDFMQLERLDAARHGRDLFVALRGQDWVWDYMGSGPFADDLAFAAWLSSVQDSLDPFFYAIRDKATGKAAGFASFLRIEPTHGVIEIGYIMISPALQRTPAATEAISAMMAWAFQAGYRRVEWKCDALNAPSMAAARRFGFTYEGTFRQHMIYKSRNRDTAWWAVTDSDWPALHRAHTLWLDPGNFDVQGLQKVRLSQLTSPSADGPDCAP